MKYLCNLLPRQPIIKTQPFLDTKILEKLPSFLDTNVLEKYVHFT